MEYCAQPANQVSEVFGRNKTLSLYVENNIQHSCTRVHLQKIDAVVRRHVDENAIDRVEHPISKLVEHRASSVSRVLQSERQRSAVYSYRAPFSFALQCCDRNQQVNNCSRQLIIKADR